MSETPTTPKGAAELTAVANATAASLITFDDEADFQRAQKGLIATLPEARVVVDDQVVWDCARYDFLRDHHESPETVHPGLWRQGRLNAIHGLFEVT
ncbi:MAG: MBL fold metallo-hydrolase, partial [Actinomycetota bacterium]|nr:MBL fold metallo-hydrolase [Actinomycetota bacterium]